MHNKYFEVINNVILTVTNIVALTLAIYAIVTVNGNIPGLQEKVLNIENNVQNIQQELINLSNLSNYLNGQINPLLTLTRSILDYQNNLQQANNILLQTQQQYLQTQNLSNFMLNEVTFIQNNLNVVELKTNDLTNITGYWTGQISTLSSLGLNLIIFQNDLITTQSSLNNVIIDLNNANQTIYNLIQLVGLQKCVNCATIVSANINDLCFYGDWVELQKVNWPNCGPLIINTTIEYSGSNYCGTSGPSPGLLISVSFDQNPLVVFSTNLYVPCGNYDYCTSSIYTNQTIISITQSICWQNISLSINSGFNVIGNVVSIISIEALTNL